MIDLYLKKVFSTRACWWYPDSFFHCRPPTFLTRLTVRSRALGRFDLVAVLLGGLHEGAVVLGPSTPSVLRLVLGVDS